MKILVLRVIKSSRHRKCFVRGQIHSLFVSKALTRSSGFSTQTTRAYNPVRHTLYDVNYMYVRHFCFRLFDQNKDRQEIYPFN